MQYLWLVCLNGFSLSNFRICVDNHILSHIFVELLKIQKGPQIFKASLYVQSLKYQPSVKIISQAALSPSEQVTLQNLVNEFWLGIGIESKYY